MKIPGLDGSFFNKSKVVVFAGFIAMLSACRGGESDNKLTIATSANMAYSIKELTEAFSNETGITCNIVLGSSGKLTAQIMEGAPFDLLVAADMEYPNEVFRSGLADGPPVVYARGQLVLWAAAAETPPTIEEMLQESIKNVAIPNPDLAPYGRAAREYLISQGIYEEIKAKLVFGESIAQTSQFIISGATPMGFTALSMVIAPQMKDKGRYSLVESKYYSPLLQGVVVLKTDNLDKAVRFRDFLLGDEAQALLKKSGYSKYE